MAVSQNRGPKYRPLNTRVLTLGTPKEVRKLFCGFGFEVYVWASTTWPEVLDLRVRTSGPRPSGVRSCVGPDLTVFGFPGLVLGLSAKNLELG